MALDKMIVKHWMRRIEASHLSVDSFLSRYKVPFSRTQYYEYKNKLLNENYNFKIPRKANGNQKICEREELFLRGCLAGGVSPTVDELREMMEKDMQIVVNRTTISRALIRLFPDYKPRLGRPKTQNLVNTTNPFGGFELIVAVAFHLKWHERFGKVIIDATRELKRKRIWRDRAKVLDVKGRTREGRFTKKYNQRADVRANRFASVSDKREGKNWDSMNILRDQASTLCRKNLAILSLPIITSNGHVRTVNLPHGQALDDLCGFNYKQATLNKFLGELKYLGIAERLLKDLPDFWKKCWGKDVSQMQTSALCYGAHIS